MRYAILVKIAMCILLSVCVSLAQLNTASILGTVTDSSGAVVPSASVTVQNQDTGATYNITADGRGNFVAPLLTVGVYRVTADATGFQTQVQENIRLSVSERLNLSIPVEPGAISEPVTVTGESPIVDTASTTLGGVVESRQVKDLPLNGRNVSQLLAVVPGVSILGPSTQQ